MTPRGFFILRLCPLLLHLVSSDESWDSPLDESIALIQTRASALRVGAQGFVAPTPLESVPIHQDSFVAEDGFITAGNDIFAENTTSEKAKFRCLSMPLCEGFTYENAALAKTGSAVMYYKSRNEVVKVTPVGSATSYRRMRELDGAVSLSASSPTNIASVDESTVTALQTEPSANVAQTAHTAVENLEALRTAQSAVADSSTSTSSKANSALRAAADAIKAAASQSQAVSDSASAKAAADTAVATDATAVAARANFAATESTATETAAIEKATVDVSAAESAAQIAISTRSAAIAAARAEEAASARLAVDGVAAENIDAQRAVAVEAATAAKAIASAAAKKAAVTASAFELSMAAASAATGYGSPATMSLLQIAQDAQETDPTFRHASPGLLQPGAAATAAAPDAVADATAAAAVAAAAAALPSADPATPDLLVSSGNLQQSVTSAEVQTSAIAQPVPAGVVQAFPVGEYSTPVGPTPASQSDNYQYLTPASQYLTTPGGEYLTPAGQYSMPVAGFSTPVAEYAAPVAGYSTPVAEYSTPASEYSTSVGELPPWGSVEVAPIESLTAATPDESAAALGPQPAGWGPNFAKPAPVQPAGWGGAGKRRPTVIAQTEISDDDLFAAAVLQASTAALQPLPQQFPDVSAELNSMSYQIS